jgi:hypothetical protein
LPEPSPGGGSGSDPSLLTGRTRPEYVYCRPGLPSSLRNRGEQQLAEEAEVQPATGCIATVDGETGRSRSVGGKTPAPRFRSRPALPGRAQAIVSRPALGGWPDVGGGRSDRAVRYACRMEIRPCRGFCGDRVLLRARFQRYGATARAPEAGLSGAVGAVHASPVGHGARPMDGVSQLRTGDGCIRSSTTFLALALFGLVKAQMTPITTQRATTPSAL